MMALPFRSDLGADCCAASALDGLGEVSVAREQRRLAAVLAADVVGYSRLMGCDESGTLARFRSATELRKYLVQDRTNATSRSGSEESAVGGKPDMRQTSQNRRK
jgi:hypothetical protein